MLDPKTGLTTTQNTIQTHTMNLTGALIMQAYGIGWAHDPACFARPLALGFSLMDFPFLYFDTFFIFFIYFILPHLGCWRKGVKIP
jgi:hypothetical protein